MSALSDFFQYWYEWISLNLWQILFSIIAITVIFLVYKLLSRQITRWKEQEKLEENIAFTLRKIFQFVFVIIIFIVVFVQFSIEIGVIASLFALAGGTIVGFAATNTIGNAIAGIIVMTSRPFRIGDRIFFNGQYADVEAIDLIYTRMKTLDNVLVSIPNQELLRSEIDNYGKKTILRRNCSITADYELTFEQVEKALLEAVSSVKKVLKKPNPYVWITDFKDFAVEYTIYVFIDEIKHLREIDSNLKRAVLETCQKHKIDISTPRLIRRVESNSN